MVCLGLARWEASCALFDMRLQPLSSRYAHRRLDEDDIRLKIRLFSRQPNLSDLASYTQASAGQLT